jgi:hypothetical protein
MLCKETLRSQAKSKQGVACGLLHFDVRVGEAVVHGAHSRNARPSPRHLHAHVNTST